MKPAFFLIVGLLFLMSFQNCAKVDPNKLADDGSAAKLDGAENQELFNPPVQGANQQQQQQGNQQQQQQVNQQQQQQPVGGGGGGATSGMGTQLPNQQQQLPPVATVPPQEEICEEIEIAPGQRHERHHGRIAGRSHGKFMGCSKHKVEKVRVCKAKSEPKKHECRREKEEAGDLCEQARKQAEFQGQKNVENLKREEKNVIAVQADGLDSLSNVEGKIVLVGMANGAVVDSISKVRGKLILCNLEVKSMSDVRGKVVAIDSKINQLDGANGNIRLIRSEILEVSDINGKIFENEGEE